MHCIFARERDDITYTAAHDTRRREMMWHQILFQGTHKKETKKVSASTSAQNDKLNPFLDEIMRHFD